MEKRTIKLPTNENELPHLFVPVLFQFFQSPELSHFLIKLRFFVELDKKLKFCKNKTGQGVLNSLNDLKKNFIITSRQRVSILSKKFLFSK